MVSGKALRNLRLRRVVQGMKRDRRNNQHGSATTPRILVLRHRIRLWRYNDHFLEWLKSHPTGGA